MVSNTRLYGAAIALASGGYSLWSASTMPRTGAGLVMLVLGVIVVVHGVVLLTDYADRLGDASGPLMVGYAVVMLLVQVLLAAGMMGSGMGSGGMGGGMGGMDGGMMAGTMADAGMIALALLMLVSGLIMLRDGGSGDGEMPRERM